MTSTAMALAVNTAEKSDHDKWRLGSVVWRRITSLIYLSPPTTAVMGWAMFGEILSWQAIAGMAVAMTGVALAVRNR